MLRVFPTPILQKRELCIDHFPGFPKSWICHSKYSPHVKVRCTLKISVLLASSTPVSFSASTFFFFCWKPNSGQMECSAQVLQQHRIQIQFELPKGFGEYPCTSQYSHKLQLQACFSVLAVLSGLSDAVRYQTPF